MTSIDVDRVSKSYRGVATPALDDVTVTAPSGEVLAVLGPSGSGKSTLLKVVAGIETPDRGRVRLGEEDVTTVPAHRRGAVLMFQRANLFPYLSVADNVAFGLRVRGTPTRAARGEAERMLELMELGGTGRRRPAQLSGGEQQRVALARALVTRPRVLLLDEPLSSLDPAVRQTLQDAVRRVQRELAVTTVLVTHDRGEAMAMADRVALVEAGRLLACDRARTVYERPPTIAAARLVGVDTFLTGELANGMLRSPTGDVRVPEDVLGGLGARVTVAIRPENVSLSPACGPETVGGRVVGTVFRGEFSEVRVAVGDRELRARTTAHPPPVGAEVHVRLPCEHLFPVRDTAEDGPVGRSSGD